MPERHPVSARRSRPYKFAVGVLSAITMAIGVAACTEDIKGGAGCPTLCPTQPNAFRDTTLDVIDLDSTLSGFPTLGLAQSLLLASRPDTVESSIVIRYDALPTAFTPNGVGVDTVTITRIDSAFLRVVIDSTGARGVTQVELQAYDVDTTELSPTPATLRALFRPDRLIGSVPLTTIAARDTVRIPISTAVLEKKIADKSRVRIGIRLAGSTSSQVRILAFSSAGVASPLLVFDPSTDTTYLPVGVTPNTLAGGTTSEELLASAVSSLPSRSTPDAGPQLLSVGGFPSRRTYLRFNIPRVILDSSAVVRAELVLTQVRSPGVDPGDSISVIPLIGATTSQLTDIRRSMDLAVEGQFAFPQVLGIRIVPADSGTRSFNILGALNNWSALPAGTPKVLILRSSSEGSEPGEFRFYSMEAPANLRPRLRITFLPRVDRALP